VDSESQNTQQLMCINRWRQHA